jgi:hypothetical protein
MTRLYLDEDVHKKVATALRLKGYDVISTHEAQKQSLSDYQQLEYAISQQRAIFTFNVGDFDGKLSGEFEMLYDALHIAGYYRGLIYNTNTVKDAFKAAKALIEKMV